MERVLNPKPILPMDRQLFSNNALAVAGQSGAFEMYEDEGEKP